MLICISSILTFLKKIFKTNYLKLVYSIFKPTMLHVCNFGERWNCWALYDTLNQCLQQLATDCVIYVEKRTIFFICLGSYPSHGELNITRSYTAKKSSTPTQCLPINIKLPISLQQAYTSFLINKSLKATENMYSSRRLLTVLLSFQHGNICLVMWEPIQTDKQIVLLYWTLLNACNPPQQKSQLIFVRIQHHFIEVGSTSEAW